jgi:hypothetical protein
MRWLEQFVQPRNGLIGNEEDTKIDLKEIMFDALGWMQLAEDRVKEYRPLS